MNTLTIVLIAVISFLFAVLWIQVICYCKKRICPGKVKIGDLPDNTKNSRKNSQKRNSNPFCEENDVGRPRDKSSLQVLEKTHNNSYMSDVAFVQAYKDTEKLNRSNYNSAINSARTSQRNVNFDNSVNCSPTLQNTQYISVFNSNVKNACPKYKKNAEFCFPDINSNFDSETKQKLHTSYSTGHNALCEEKENSDYKDSARAFLMDENEVESNEVYSNQDPVRKPTFGTTIKTQTKNSNDQVVLDYDCLDEEDKSKNDQKTTNPNSTKNTTVYSNNTSMNSIQIKTKKVKSPESNDSLRRSENFDKTIDSSTISR